MPLSCITFSTDTRLSVQDVMLPAWAREKKERITRQLSAMPAIGLPAACLRRSWPSSAAGRSRMKMHGEDSFRISSRRNRWIVRRSESSPRAYLINCWPCSGRKERFSCRSRKCPMAITLLLAKASFARCSGQRTARCPQAGYIGISTVRSNGVGFNLLQVTSAVG